MGKKTAFPVTKGTVGNKTSGMTLAEDPAMRNLSEVYEDMTDHERERTVEYLKVKAGGGAGIGNRDATPVMGTLMEIPATHQG